MFELQLSNGKHIVTESAEKLAEFFERNSVVKETPKKKTANEDKEKNK